MMFWIMLPCNIFTLIFLHVSMKGSGKPNGNIVLGVKIPTYHLNDTKVQGIVTEFENKYKKIFWPMMLLQIIGYPIRHWVSLSLLWIFIYIAIMICVYMKCIEHYGKKLRTLKKEEGWVLEGASESNYVDDDEYWTSFSYNNPHDPRTWVPKRIGIGTTMNMATVGGKVFGYVIAGVIIVTILWSMWMTIPVDFDTVAMEEKGEGYEIGIWGDTYELRKDKIVSVSLLDEIPTAYKNIGASTSRMKTGTFSVKGYGQSAIYAMVDVPLYIVVELKDGSFVFINGEDIETTQEYYEMLKKQ